MSGLFCSKPAFFQLFYCWFSFLLKCFNSFFYGFTCVQFFQQYSMHGCMVDLQSTEEHHEKETSQNESRLCYILSVKVSVLPLYFLFVLYIPIKYGNSNTIWYYLHKQEWYNTDMTPFPYSQVSNRCPPSLLIFRKFSTQDILIPHTPFIKFQKMFQPGHL